MQLGDLRDLVIANTNRSDKLSIIDKAINLAIREIDSRHNFNFTRGLIELAVVSGDATVALPDDCKAVLDVRVGSADTTIVTQLQLLPKSTLTRMYPSEQSTVSGRPCYGYVESGELHFMPPASMDFTLLVTRDSKQPELVSVTDTTLSPTIDNVIVSWATSYLYRSIGMYRDAQYWSGEYERALLEAVRGDQRKPGELRQMRGANPETSLTPLNSGDPYENKYTRT
jgi:hypothetical protein